MDAKMNLYESLNVASTHYFNSFHLMEHEGKLEDSITNFCKCPDEKTAMLVYQAFLYTYRKTGLNTIVAAMQNFEKTSSKLIPRHRDHYIHTVNVFLLGLAIYDRNEKVQKAVEIKLQYPDSYPEIHEEFLYRWGMTSLFHDVGYPLEIAYKTINEFTSMLMEPNLQYDNGHIINNNIVNIHNPIAVLNFPNIDNLLNINMLLPDAKFENEYYNKYPELKTHLPKDILVAIAKNISKNLEFSSPEIISEKLRECLEFGLKNGQIDHGIYSSIILLKWMNEAYLKTHWNPAYFYIPLIDSATAILLHNAYDYVFQTPSFNLGPLAIEEHPLGFLLILCDRIQENDRVSYGYISKGIEFTSNSIEISNQQLSLHLFISPDIEENIAIQKAEEIKTSVYKSIDIGCVFEEFEIIIQKEPPSVKPSN